jgi:hypothetical protein
MSFLIDLLLIMWQEPVHFRLKFSPNTWVKLVDMEGASSVPELATDSRDAMSTDLWRPRFLITVINANGRINRVKSADTGQTTSKTSPMNPIEPLDQVYAHPWSTLG